MLENKKNGYVIDPYDPKSFGACIQTLLKDKEMRENMRKESEKIIDKFRFENVSKGYMEAIAECMK